MKASSEGAVAVFWGSWFHSWTVLGKKELEKYNLLGMRSRGMNAWVGIFCQIGVWLEKAARGHVYKIICHLVEEA